MRYTSFQSVVNFAWYDSTLPFDEGILLHVEGEFDIALDVTPVVSKEFLEIRNRGEIARLIIQGGIQTDHLDTRRFYINRYEVL